MPDKIYDVLIVGGGILGTFHAYHALEKGLRVALLEKDAKPRGATVRNFGQIVPSGMDAKWQRFGRRSLEIYKSLQAKFDISLGQNGSIYLASDEEELRLLHELNEINQQHDYESQVWSAQKCLDHYEGLRNDYCKGGLYFPEEVTLQRPFSSNFAQQSTIYSPLAMSESISRKSSSTCAYSSGRRNLIPQ